MGIIYSNTGKGNWRFFPRARDGFGALLEALHNAGELSMVFLPSYIGWSSREGSGVFDPIDERSLPFSFYPVKSDLTIDLQEFRLVVSRAPEKSVLLVIHYFGRPDPSLKEIVALARESGMLIVEDAAHALFSGEYFQSCGVDGDVVLYSFHKMFPVSGGGAVKLNTPRVLAYCNALAPANIVDLPWEKVSEADIEKSARTRLSKYNSYESLVSNMSPHVWPLWRGLPKGTIPQSYPVLVDKKELRDRLYFELKERGYPVASLYHQLIKPLMGTWNESSLTLANHIFNLPLSDQITDNAITEIGSHICRVIGKGVPA